MSELDPYSLLDVPVGWGVAPLGSLVDSVRGISYGIVQPGQHRTDGVPIVRVSDLHDGRVDTTAPMRVDPVIEKRHSRTRLRGGEVLLSLVGSVGMCAVAPDELEGWNTARAVATQMQTMSCPQSSGGHPGGVEVRNPAPGFPLEDCGNDELESARPAENFGESSTEDGTSKSRSICDSRCAWQPRRSRQTRHSHCTGAVA